MSGDGVFRLHIRPLSLDLLKCDSISPRPVILQMSYEEHTTAWWTRDTTLAQMILGT